VGDPEPSDPIVPACPPPTQESTLRPRFSPGSFPVQLFGDPRVPDRGRRPVAISNPPTSPPVLAFWSPRLDIARPQRPLGRSLNLIQSGKAQVLSSANLTDTPVFSLRVPHSLGKAAQFPLTQFSRTPISPTPFHSSTSLPASSRLPEDLSGKRFGSK
jgi:hypothetical protein